MNRFSGMSGMMRSLASTAVCLALTALVGCGGSGGGSDTATISGKITYKMRPSPAAPSRSIPRRGRPIPSASSPTAPSTSPAFPSGRWKWQSIPAPPSRPARRLLGSPCGRGPRRHPPEVQGSQDLRADVGHQGGEEQQEFRAELTSDGKRSSAFVRPHFDRQPAPSASPEADGLALSAWRKNTSEPRP